MNFDLTTTLLYFIGIALVVIAGVYGMAVNQIMGIRVHRPKFQLKDQSDIPHYLLEVYQGALTSLKSLGFEVHHCQLSNDIVAHEHSEKWSMVLLNPQTHVFADLSPASTFLDLPGYEVDFWTVAKDGTALVTLNGRGHTILCNIPNVEFNKLLLMNVPLSAPPDTLIPAVKFMNIQSLIVMLSFASPLIFTPKPVPLPVILFP